jgi:aminopeptidase
VRDPRVDALARILVAHSTGVKAGDVCTIEGESASEPLLQAIYEEVLKAGGNPILNMSTQGQSASYFRHASDEQLEWVSPVAEWAVENADVRFAVMASVNTRELSSVEPDRQTKRQAATQHLMKRAMERSAAGEYRWALTLFPTHAYASEAKMSLTDYEDFYYRACLATEADPVAAWKRASEETERLRDWIEGRSEVRVSGPGTDLRLGIEGRTFIAADGKHNMPDGEFFTGPVEDSAEGEITFHLPATYGGREVSGVRFRFDGGKVVDASAERGEEFLIEMLDTDEGARRLGELGIGTNYGITDGTGEILLDEKIGGTVHLAVGRSYPETGGVNQSAIHWDMICDLRKGGSIAVDGETLQQDGRFAI